MNRPAKQEFLTKRHLLWACYILICLVLSVGLFTEYPLLPIAVVVGVVFAVLIVFRPFVGLIIYSVFLMIRPQEFIDVIEFSPIPLERAVAGLLIISILLKIIKNGFQHRFDRIDYSLMAYVAVCGLSIMGSIYISQSIDSWMDLLRLFIIYLFVLFLVESERQMRLFILFIIFSSVFHSFASVINYYMGNYVSNVYMGIDRATGIDQSLSGPNSLAATMVYTLPLIYYYYLATSSRFVRFLIIATTPVLILCIILTGSRTGMAGTLFFLLLVLWQNKNRIRNIVVMGAVLVLIWIAMPGQYQDRFASTTDFSSGTASAVSARARVEGLIKGILMAMDRPLTGVGIGNYSVAAGTIYSVGDWHRAHNLLGEILGEIGFLGTTTFIVWLVFLFKTMHQLKRRTDTDKTRFYYLTLLGLRMQLLCLLFMGLASHNLYRYNWYIISALVVVMTQSSFLAASETKNENHPVKDKPKIDLSVSN